MGVSPYIMKQDQLSMQLSTPLGQDVLVVKSMRGYERFSTPFEIEVEAVSKTPDVNVDDIIGKSVTLTLDLGDQKRYFNGIVGEFSQGHTPSEKDPLITLYELKLYPTLWTLNFKQRCQVFQNKSAVDIMSTLFEESNVTFKKQIQSAGMSTREYCVQYNETDLSFVHRLMAEEGLLYFFTHSNGSHELILSDSSDAYRPCEGGADKVSFEERKSVYDFLNVITGCVLQQKIVSNAYAGGDFNFTKATSKINFEAKGKGLATKKRIYQFPGDYDQEDKADQGRLESLLKNKIESLEWGEKMLSGTSTVPFFGVGYKFRMEKHPRKDANKEYVLSSVSHEYDLDPVTANGPALYKNTFHGVPSDVNCRLFLKEERPKVLPQTAIVTGPEGEEIWTDKYGRVKVRFHWDQSDTQGESSSCWLRVRQGMAGNNWGMLFLPRIGQEVIVEFLGGDPSRPFVSGALYNSKNMPPYLPDMPTKSTIKTQSTKEGGPHFNEFRFDDLKDKEQIYLHAQKDYDRVVEQTYTTKIHHGSEWKWIDRGDRHIILSGKGDAVAKNSPEGEDQEAGHGDDHLTLDKGSRTMTLKGQGDGKGNYTIKIGKGDRNLTLNKGDETIKIDEGNYSRTLSKGDYSQTIADGNRTLLLQQGNEEVTLASGHQTITLSNGNLSLILSAGDRTTTINGNDTLTVEQNATMTITGNLSITVDGNITLTSAQNMAFSAAENMTFSAGAAINVNAGEGVNMQAGAEVAINAGGNINLAAGGGVEAEAGGVVSLSAGGATHIDAAGAFSVEAGGAVNLAAGANLSAEAGAAIEISAGAATNIASASVSIEAALVTII